jgi:Domain of unknown function (DUF4032)
MKNIHEIDPQAILRNSTFYREFMAEREEILKHKWYESEKAGKDIGFEKALLDWMLKYRTAWRKARYDRMLNQTDTQKVA